MMYPRLKLARNLLTDDGVIFISIDDTEVANLRKILDEIFGENNFIASITRNTNSSKNQSLFVSVSHDYCLIYARDISVLSTKHAENKWSVPKNNIEEYKRKIEELKNLGLSNEQITEELKQLTKYPRFIDFVNYWYVDERGVYRKDNLGGVKNGNMTPIINPLTGKEDPVPPGGFRYSPEKLNELIKKNRIHFHTDGSLPTIKRYLDENLTQRPKSIMSDDQRPDNALLKEFNTPFDNPKQLAFMKRILSVGDKDSIILDFFSGSATTAHAVMQLNAEDGGNRKFIMVQLPEKTDEKSEAYKAGYKNICEIGKERIRRAGEKIVQETGKTDLDIGFKVFKLDSSNIDGF
ncbi:Adenine specific DNA methylase Mod [[Flavobacterium] thermophilum]|nr:Adenine specific DNA methylase Mod [[Flavobacterium] thermophilum]